MLIIRLAEKNEYDKVRSFYHSLIDAMQNAQYNPQWEKEVYPSDEYLQDSINKKELFVGMIDNKICSAMIVNHEYNESYDKVEWTTKAKTEEIMVIHALGVHPDFGGRGIAKELVAKVISHAEDSHQKVIRLDVLEGNVPAEKLYRSMGFKYVDTIKMYYEDTGWTDFELYEYQL